MKVDEYIITDNPSAFFLQESYIKAME